jgi:nucleoside 2-deoxyribosyltransferase
VKIYYAAPWFSTEQADIHERVHAVLKVSRHQIFSPKHELEVRPNDSKDRRRVAFTQNLTHICAADFLVAVTDHKDVGTIFECGYAYRSGKSIIYFAETLGDKPFNLMLAESGTIVIRSTSELNRILYSIESKSDLERIRYEYEGAIE